jgi:hypothetical protein
VELRLVGPEGREWESHEHAFSDGVIEGAEREAARWRAMKAAETPREQVTILPDPRPRTPYLLVGLGALIGGLVTAVGFLAAPEPQQMVQPIVVQLVPSGDAVSVPESSSWPLTPSTPEIAVTPAPEDEWSGSGPDGGGGVVPAGGSVTVSTTTGATETGSGEAVPGGAGGPSSPAAVQEAPATPSTPAPQVDPPSTPGPPAEVPTAPATPDAPEPGLVGGLLGGVGGLVDDVVCVLVCV